MSTKLQDMVPVQTGDRLGEIITWVPPTRTKVSALREAMAASGIDKKFLPDLMPKSAFKRMCKKLTDHRLIEQVGQDETYIEFQFTQKDLDQSAGVIDYTFETKVRINKMNGTVESEDEGIRHMVEKMVTEEMGYRIAMDITRTIQAIIDDQGDFFPLRERGGVYFVPDSCREVVDKIDSMLERIGGTMNRFSVEFDKGRNEAGAADAIFGKLSMMVNEFNKYVTEFDGKMTEKRNIKMTSKLNLIKTKFQLYQTLLLDKSDELKQLVEQSDEILQNKIAGNLPVVEVQVDNKQDDGIEPDIEKIEVDAEHDESEIESYDDDGIDEGVKEVLKKVGIIEDDEDDEDDEELSEELTNKFNAILARFNK